MFAEQNSQGQEAFAEREVGAEWAVGADQDSKGREMVAEQNSKGREVVAGRGEAPPLHYVYEHSISL